MKKIELRFRKLLRLIFGCISLTAVAFIFQACYGIVDDMYYDIRFSGTVLSNTTNLPVKGIKVTVNDMNYNMVLTDEDGKFDFYASIPENIFDDEGNNISDEIKVHFRDIDDIENGLFADTTVIVKRELQNEVIINMQMVEIQ